MSVFWNLLTNVSSLLPWQIFTVIIAFCGVSAITAMFTPQFLLTWRTNNTVGINKNMFTISVICAFCFAIAALASLVDDCVSTTGTVHMKIIFSMFTCLNTYTFSLSCYILNKKINNQTQATTLGLSEIEYFKQHVEK